MIRDKDNHSVDVIRKPNSKSVFCLKGVANNKSFLESLSQENSMHMLTNIFSNSHNVSINGFSIGNELENKKTLLDSNFYKTNGNNYSNRHFNSFSDSNHSHNLTSINNIKV